MSEKSERLCQCCGKRDAEQNYRYCTHCDKLKMNAREAYLDE